MREMERDKRDERGRQKDEKEHEGRTHQCNLYVRKWEMHEEWKVDKK